jgi:hypothetical protein
MSKVIDTGCWKLDCRSWRINGSGKSEGGMRHADTPAGGADASYVTSFIPTAEVGRASVPADMGRHGGRPYDSARPESLFRIKLATLAARGAADTWHPKPFIGFAMRHPMSSKFSAFRNPPSEFQDLSSVL